MPSYDVVFEKIADRWICDSLDMKPSEVPDIVYHYTNAAGLAGFLKSGEIWLTDFRFLNDSAEFTQSVDIMRRLILEKNVKCSALLSKFYSKILLISSAETRGSGYVFSLTSERDDLSQWRGYANEGVGFTIGFSGELLNKASEEGFNFSRVSYDEGSERRVLEKALKEIENKMISECADNAEDEDDIVLDAANNFNWLAKNRASSSKHKSFQSEKELRLVTFREESADGIEVRVSGDRLVPYVKLTLGEGGRLPIRSIGVGPGFKGAEVVDAVRALAKMYGYDPAIYFAQTPYRRP